MSVPFLFAICALAPVPSFAFRPRTRNHSTPKLLEPKLEYVVSPLWTPPLFPDDKQEEVASAPVKPSALFTVLGSVVKPPMEAETAGEGIIRAIQEAVPQNYFDNKFQCDELIQGAIPLSGQAPLAWNMHDNGRDHPCSCENLVNSTMRGVKKSVSKAWCTGRVHNYKGFVPEPMRLPRDPDAASERRYEPMRVTAYGITAIVTPLEIPLDETLPVLVGRPHPTACRSGENGTSNESFKIRTAIANTYKINYARASDDVEFGKTDLRHGVLFYAKKHDETTYAAHKAWIKNQLTRLISFLGSDSPVVSLNLQTYCHPPIDSLFRASCENYMITEQRGTFTSIMRDTASLTYGVNWGGQQFSYVGFNYEALKRMTILAINELRAHLLPDLAVVPGVSPPAACQYKTLAVFGFSFGSYKVHRDLLISTHITQQKKMENALDDVSETLRDPKQKIGHVRASVVCVLAQLKVLFVHGLEQQSETLFATNWANKTDKRTSPGLTNKDKIRNAIRGVVLLEKLAYGGSIARREADILRVVASSAFLGVNQWVNCKSGQDRTGAVSAVGVSFAMMVYSASVNDIPYPTLVPAKPSNDGWVSLGPDELSDVETDKAVVGASIPAEPDDYSTNTTGTASTINHTELQARLVVESTTTILNKCLDDLFFMALNFEVLASRDAVTNYGITPTTQEEEPGVCGDAVLSKILGSWKVDDVRLDQWATNGGAKLMNQFFNLNLRNLQVSSRITIASTGLPGLKWDKSVAAVRVFLPRHIQSFRKKNAPSPAADVKPVIDKAEAGTALEEFNVQMVSPDYTGKTVWTGCSNGRGS